MRRTPLKRTNWPRKPLAAQVRDVVDVEDKAPAKVVTLHRAVMVRVPTDVVAVPKHRYVRSKKLMQAYREIPCQNCGIADGTVCGAHSNWLAHHKGKSVKADDNRCASLCNKCHTLLDQGSTMTKAERLEVWTAAHKRTVKRLLQIGLWPKEVPLP